MGVEHYIALLRRQVHFIYRLTKVHFMVRYSQNKLGLLWHILSPLALFGLLVTIFGRRLGVHIEHYPLYVLSGMIVWNFFAAGTTIGMRVFLQNGNIIKSLCIRSDALLFSGVLSTLVTFCMELVAYIIIAVALDHIPTALIYLVPILAVQFIFVTGVGAVLASIHIFVPDISQVWQFALRLGWFATPIFYALTESGPGQKVNTYNPMYYFIDLSRSVLIDHSAPDWSQLMMLGMVSVVVFLLGYSVFRHVSLYAAEFV